MKFILDNSSFLWIKSNEALFYNSSSHHHVSMILDDEIKIAFCNYLSVPEHFGRITFDESSREALLCNVLTEKGIGTIEPDSTQQYRLPNIPIINRDVERIPTEERCDYILRNYDLSNYVTTITIYVGGHSKINSYYEQIPYPLNSNYVLSADDIISFIRTVSDTLPSVSYKIVVSEPDEFDFENFGIALGKHPNTTLFLLHETFNQELCNWLQSTSLKMTVLIDSDCDKEQSDYIESKNVIYTMLIKSDKGIEHYKRLVKRIPNLNFECIADNNLDFFRKHVFESKDDILKSKTISKRMIYIHQKLNLNYWGNLFVFPDKKIYSNPNRHGIDPLGTLNDNILSLVAKELSYNYSWRKLRDSPKCSQCLCQWLCPSPSCYERTFNLESFC